MPDNEEPEVEETEEGAVEVPEGTLWAGTEPDPDAPSKSKFVEAPRIISEFAAADEAAYQEELDAAESRRDEREEGEVEELEDAETKARRRA